MTFGELAKMQEKREERRIANIGHEKQFFHNVSTMNLRPGQMWKTTTKRITEKQLWRILFKFGGGDTIEYLFYSTKKGAMGYGYELAKGFTATHYSMHVELAYPEKKK